MSSMAERYPKNMSSVVLGLKEKKKDYPSTGHCKKKNAKHVQHRYRIHYRGDCLLQGCLRHTVVFTVIEI